MFKKLPKSFFYTTLALVLPFVVQAADLEPLSIRDFGCGLVTTYDPTVIDNGCAQQGWNIDVWTGRLQKRRGSLLQNSTPLTGNQPVRFEKEFPDQNGNKWFITASSNSLFKSNNSGGTNDVLTSANGISASSQFSSVNAYGKIRLVDGSTHCIVFDGTNVTTSTATPRGTLIAFMFERIFVANVSGANSVLYMSRFGDPEDWTDDGLADNDAATVFIRQNDGYPIRALIPYGNLLLVFKDQSIDAITMDNSGLVPIVTAISNNIGTQHPKSIQVRYNDVIFMGPDGFYSLFGNSITNISQGIKPTFDNILQRNSTSRSLTLTTKADFDTGTSSGIATSVVQNSLVLSTWAVTDSLVVDFASGTLIGMNTYYITDAITLSTANVNNFSFETNDLTGWTNDASIATASGDAYDGTYYALNGSLVACFSFSLVLKDTNSVTLTSMTGNFATSYTAYVLDLAAYYGRKVSLYVGTINQFGVFVSLAHTDSFTCTGSSVTVFAKSNSASSSLTSRFVQFDYVTGGSIDLSNKFISRPINTGFTSPSWLPSFVSTASNGHTLTWGTQVSTSADGVWDSTVSWTPGLAPTSASKRFIRYNVLVSTIEGGTALPYIQDVTIAARSSFGDYLSAVQSIGTNINAWGLFSANNTSNGGNITLAIYTDTNSVITINDSNSWLSSQTITSGNIPTISTAPFLFFYTTMSVTASTQAPQVDDFVINWNEGASNFPVASLFYEGDYFAAVSTKSVTANDTIFVYDRNNKWSPPYTGLNCYSLALYNQQAFCGSSLAGDIFRIQVDGVYSDNGSAIDSFWKSKEFDFGYTMTDKTMKKYFVTAKYNATSSVTFAYGINRGATTSASLNLASTSGFFRQVIPTPSLTYNRGISHSFSFRNSTIDQYFDVLAVELWPRLETPPGP